MTHPQSKTTTTQQHTPGPAFVQRCTDGSAEVTLIDGNMQRSIPVPMFHAAPTMLEALRKAHSAISDLDTIDNPVARAIYDLIAKATGAGES